MRLSCILVVSIKFTSNEIDKVQHIAINFTFFYVYDIFNRIAFRHCIHGSKITLIQTSVLIEEGKI